ncbi:hypothetical protein NUW54_g6523 [Trametes sanguinea]|uniref:Uncharacterized protein n=1 Tax=Trametes sanguinea TaxID=158606 RepID=A0ACC1PS40_9APHY|nr:hypothetical protein NUW54_g6523 [Trametes sanguinea]
MPSGKEMSNLLRGGDALLKFATFLSELVMIHRCWSMWDHRWPVFWLRALRRLPPALRRVLRVLSLLSAERSGGHGMRAGSVAAHMCGALWMACVYWMGIEDDGNSAPVVARTGGGATVSYIAIAGFLPPHYRTYHQAGASHAAFIEGAPGTPG